MTQLVRLQDPSPRKLRVTTDRVQLEKATKKMPKKEIVNLKQECHSKLQVRRLLLSSALARESKMD